MRFDAGIFRHVARKSEIGPRPGEAKNYFQAHCKKGTALARAVGTKKERSDPIKYLRALSLTKPRDFPPEWLSACTSRH